jgi:two-component system sensor histidine kinase BarA
MFGRIRRLEISLAAKCQILFGAAVILIIAAALLVPWQRMEQLTEQLDERAAAALADDALARHAGRAATKATPTDVPTRSAPATTAPADIPSPANAFTVTLIPLGGNEPLSKFDRKALVQFSRHREHDPEIAYYERKDGTDGYRYARPLFLNRTCAACHAMEEGGLSTFAPSVTEASLPSKPPVLAPVGPAAPTTGPVSTGSANGKGDRERPPFVGVVSVDMPSRIDARELLLNRVFILTAGLLAGTLATITFYVITTRLILQPVRVLQETAEKVSEGDLNIRSDISTGDEFQQLSETFNTMLANLKDNADQLRSINKGLDLKLGQLAESNLALYESNRLKSEFLANVSHELRTPLNSILGFADLLKDALAQQGQLLAQHHGGNGNGAGPSPAVAGKGATKPGTDVKNLRYVNNILQSSRNLLDLINDLLDLAKIEAGRVEIRSEPLSLPDLFEGLLNVLKPLSEQKGLTVSAAVAPDVPILHTDAAKLQQVLYNFLSNAIKFSPPNSPIELAATLEVAPDGDGPPGALGQPVADGEHVRVSVTDRGPGIAPDKQQLIFEKFRQLEPSHTRTHGGTGLGLAISKELALLLGGSIGVRSTPGEGSTFWVVLPLKIAPGSMEMRGRLVLT